MMLAAISPEMLIAEIAFGGLAVAFFWRFIVWIRESPVTPDPWDADTEQKLAEPETAQACHHCSAPQSPTAWFCPHCGCAVGPYNNMMPYVQIFSEGEVLRNGMNQRFRNRPLVVIGYLLIIGPSILTVILSVNSTAGLALGLMIILIPTARLLRNLLGLPEQSVDQK